MSKYQTAYGKHERHQIHFSAPSKAKQSFKDECNINRIMASYEKTGLLNHVNRHQGDYGDFVGYDDYHASLNQIREAQDMFEQIPSAIRAKFSNDPANFLRFVQDPKNSDELVKMGLASEKATDPPTTPPAKPKGGNTKDTLDPPSDGPDGPTTPKEGG